jgi:prevent-host-death family protein
MRKYSVAEAKDRFSELIERALNGEAVVITRRGRAIAELKPISRLAKLMTDDAMDRLAKRRVGRRLPREDAAAAVRRIREEWRS